MSELIRSFIAVKIPSEAAGRLRAAQEQLRAAEANVKWVDSGNFHITLKFLGGVEAARLSALWGSVHESLDGSRPFTMRFLGVGAFPNLRRARVIWAGVTEGAEELGELAARVEGACAQHGFDPEKRPFRSHLTLGRVRRPVPNAKLAATMMELAEADLGRVQVDRVVLMRSELTRSGAVYHILEERPLGQGERDDTG
jgi:2'-5' RNA ligase